MNMLSILEKKKASRALTADEIRFWIRSVSEQSVPEYQSAALLMAIRLNGMDFEETTALTEAMTDSGDRFQFSGYPVLADKHSTGGIGDKVTLVLAPIMAACGLPMVMLSGRGLGFSGGTIDKFEALPGVKCLFDQDGMQRMLDELGWANSQATTAIAPADRQLYRLRDVTATVDSVPLITASILSKKLAGGASHLVLDVKCGHGAFMEKLERAKQLAGNLQSIGQKSGMQVSGVISRMEEPLGHAVGNYLELMESVHYLKRLHDTPLMELVYELGTRLMLEGGLIEQPTDARARMKAVVENGEALDRLVAYLRFCGAEPAALDRLLEDEFAKHERVPILAPTAGYMDFPSGRDLGYAMVELGAGRYRKEDDIDPMAGLTLVAHQGEKVEKGQVIAWLHGDKALADPEVARVRGGAVIHISAEPKLVPPLIQEAF